MTRVSTVLRTTVAFPISMGVPTSMVGRKWAAVGARVADTRPMCGRKIERIG